MINKENATHHENATVLANAWLRRELKCHWGCLQRGICGSDLYTAPKTHIIEWKLFDPILSKRLRTLALANHTIFNAKLIGIRYLCSQKCNIYIKDIYIIINNKLKSNNFI